MSEDHVVKLFLCLKNVKILSLDNDMRLVNSNERNICIDIMKGFGIIFVILGHMTSLLPPLVINAIFSFHMPLFFIVGGYLFRQNDNLSGQAQKDFKRLVFPYIFTCAVIVFLSFLKSIYIGSLNPFLHSIIASVYCSGSIHHSFLFSTMPSIGAIWFLIAMFWCKTIYNMIICKCNNPKMLIVLFSIIALLIDRYLVNLPFALLPGCSAMIFYLIGDSLKGIRQCSYSPYLIMVCLLSSCISIRYSHLYMVQCYYELYPVDILGACGGTFLVFKVSKFFSKTKFSGVLSWIGRGSLCILCFHLLELNFHLCEHLNIPSMWVVQFVVKILFSIFMTLICYRLSFTRQIFGLKI